MTPRGGCIAKSSAYGGAEENFSKVLLVGADESERFNPFSFECSSGAGGSFLPFSGKPKLLLPENFCLFSCALLRC